MSIVNFFPTIELLDSNLTYLAILIGHLVTIHIALSANGVLLKLIDCLLGAQEVILLTINFLNFIYSPVATLSDLLNNLVFLH